MARGPDNTLYITGDTTGSLKGKNTGGLDGFIAKYDQSLHLLWVSQFGSSADDSPYDIAVDANGNATIVGATAGSLGQKSNAGDDDAFVASFDTNGQQRFIDLFGTPGADGAFAVAIDASGSAIVFGNVSGAIDGSMPKGGSDLVLFKYDAAGKRQLLQQWGTAQDDISSSVSVTSESLYVSGQTYGSLDALTTPRDSDVFVAKLSLTGTVLWTHLLGSAGEDYKPTVSVDASGNVYVSAITAGNVDNLVSQGGEDMILAKYDGSGTRQWARLLTTKADDDAMRVRVDAHGAVYLVGLTRGALGTNYYGATDGILAIYDSMGSQHWLRQFGDKANDGFFDVVIDSDSSLWLLGNTESAVEGRKTAGGTDFFLIRYNSNGDRL
jgi:hypothetical protein